MIEFFYNMFSYLGFFSLPIFLHFLFLKQSRNEEKINSDLVWYHLLKKYFAKKAWNKYAIECKNALAKKSIDLIEKPKRLLNYEDSDSQYICGTDMQNNAIFLKITIRESRIAEIELNVKTNNGKCFVFPNQNKVILCNSNSKNEWSSEGLQISILEPFKKLRICYNGFLRNIGQSEEKAEFVQLRLIWNSCCAPLYFPQDYSADLCVEDLAREEWKDDEWITLIGDQKGYEQYGAVIGFIKSSNLTDEIPLHIPSFRKRYSGTSDNYCTDRCINVFVTTNDGTLFCVGTKKLKFGCRNLRYGSVLFGNGDMLSIKSSDISIEYCGPEEIIPKTIVINVSAGNKDIKCVINIVQESLIVFDNLEQYGWTRKQFFTNCIVNGEDGKGIISFWYQVLHPGQNFEIQNIIKPSHSNPYLSYESFVSTFDSSSCTKIALTGGKGSSLALLSSIKTTDFLIPEGFVVLSTALNYCINSNNQLRSLLKKLNDISCLTHTGNLGEICKEVTDAFSKETIPDKIVKDVVECLEKVKTTESKFDNYEIRWAVRSSGIIEDSEGFSTAGQNSTFLGCRTVDEILNAISKCWASLYAFQSVQYRRNHGLPIITDLAVVVQKMIPSDSSGVLFTCHPTTSDMSQMVITSNFGLGESVVSGQIDPDTYILSRKWNGDISLLSQTIGSKKGKIVMSETSCGIITVENKSNESNNNHWSLTKEQVLLLGNVGHHVEKQFGSPRDIEWSFYKGQLFLLQCRPVTTMNSWSDFELTHEYDDPVLSPQFAYTKANVGEVQPGCATVLSQEVITGTINEMFKKLNNSKNKATCITHHNVVMDIVKGLLPKVKEEIDPGIRAVELAVFGQYFIDKNMHNLAKRIFGTTSLLQQLPFIIETFKDTDAVASKAETIAKNFKIPIAINDSPTDMLKKIKLRLETLLEIFCCHGFISRSNIFYQCIAFSILTGNKTDTSIQDDLFHDITLILSTTSDVVSASIPKQLEEITKAIHSENIRDEFVKIPPIEGLKWLENKSAEVTRLIRKFLETHGHRVYKEFELSEKSWNKNPEKLISMIQTNCKSNLTEKSKEILSLDETLNRLVTVNSTLKRSALKYFVKKCRKSVMDREKTKCEVIRVIDKFKDAFSLLGQKLVNCGFLPNEELIFHLSLYEIERIINREDFGLVSKATRRRKLFSKWNCLKFPKVIIGVPIPIEDKPLSELYLKDRGRISVKGTPVYPGELIARACVVKNIDNIGELQNGDILITYSTDIGWSPYFPLLSGVVTEIGGLISHGAVVAREYGLPCIVGVENATEIFKTGDQVLICGKEGIIKVISEQKM